MSKYVTPLAIIAIAIGLFFLFTQGQFTAINDLKAEAAELDEALEKAEQLNEIRDELLLKYGTFDPDKVARLERLLPDHVDNVRLLIEVDTIASEYDLSIRDVEFIRPVDASQRDAAQASASPYDSIILYFAVNASYEEFLLFMQDLEKSLRLVDVEEITFEEDPQIPGSDILFEVSLRTYWLK